MSIQHFTPEQIEAWPLDSKGCKTCREVKPLSEFHITKHCLKGRATECKACRHLKSKRDYSNRPLEYRMVSRAKQRAKKKGLPFDLSPEDIKIPSHCPILGMMMEPGGPNDKATDNSPSLDRIDPAKGYVKGNIVVISYRANMIKSNASYEEIQKVADWVAGGCEITTI